MMMFFLNMVFKKSGFKPVLLIQGSLIDIFHNKSVNFVMFVFVDTSFKRR